MSGASPYELFIKLTASNGVSPVLADIARMCGLLQGNFDKLSKTMKLALGGAIIAEGGKEMLRFLGEAVVKGNEFVNVQNKMLQAGVKVSEMNKASAAAWDLTQKNMNVGATDILRLSNDMRQVFGDQTDATRFMPQAAAFMSFDKAWGAHTGKETDSEKESMAAIKIAEQEIGGATPENVQKVMEKLYRAKVASGGNVSARDMLAIRNLTGSAAWNVMSDDYKYGVLPALFQTQGTQAGVQAMQMFKKFAAGITLAKPSIAAGIDAGLIDPDKVDYDKTGRPMRVQPGGMLHASEFAENPLKMYENYIKPYLDKTFGDDAIKRAAFLGQLGGAQSPIRGLSEFDATWRKFDKDAMLPHQVKGDMKSFVDNCLYAQMDAFGVQWKNLMTALGAPAVKDATAALRSINEAIAGWVNWTSKHPVRAQIFTEVATGVSALAIAVGGLGVAAAAAKVALWGLGGTAGVAGAAAGATGLPLLAGSAGALGAAGLGGIFRRRLSQKRVRQGC